MSIAFIVTKIVEYNSRTDRRMDGRREKAIFMIAMKYGSGAIMSLAFIYV